MNLQTLYPALIILCAITATASHAERPGRDQRKPPGVALDACEGLSEEAQCQFEGRRGDTLEGSCRAVPSGELACVPDNHRGRTDHDGPSGGDRTGDL